jgi:hypothetical protein
MGLTKRRAVREDGASSPPSGEPARSVSPPRRNGGVDGTWVTDEATAWLRGEGDLLTAATGRPLSVPVQIGVLAHASLERLGDLGRYSQRGSVRRSWGTEMARLAGEVARLGQSAEGLRRLQAEHLVPLELDVLAGRRSFASRGELAAHVRGCLPLREAG